MDEKTCNPLKNWVDMGMPPSLNQEQRDLLQVLALPKIQTDRIQVGQKSLEMEFQLNANALCYFEMRPIIPEKDRGYRPEAIRGIPMK